MNKGSKRVLFTVVPVLSADQWWISFVLKQTQDAFVSMGQLIFSEVSTH